MADAADLDAATAADRIRSGGLSAETLMRACLDRIAAREPEIHAFTVIDAVGALATARAIDQGARDDRPLAGVPFAVKDVIDVAGFVTAFGSDLPIARIASRDAASVAMLRHAGAIPIGKAETVEFAAIGRVPPTRNPRDPSRSPGGSSSGSAAAVAAGMVPLALGTQTGGSLVRPASYTGIYALKPSHGAVSLAGVHPHAPSLDCVGWHARSVSDLDLVAGVFDLPGSVDQATDRLRVGFCRTAQWGLVDDGARRAVLRFVDRLEDGGIAVTPVTLPPIFDELPAAQFAIMRGEGRVSFLPWHRAWGGRLHPDLRAICEAGATAGDMALSEARRVVGFARQAFRAILAGLDVIVAPAATGEAPPFASGPGSPAMNRMWSALGAPIVAMPAGAGDAGLPVGCQLVGRRGRDRDLLAAARVIDGIARGDLRVRC